MSTLRFDPTRWILGLVGGTLLFALTACQPLQLPQSPLAQADTATIEAAAEATVAVTDAVMAGQPVSDEVAATIMGDLAWGQEGAANAATQAILTANDERFVPVLIELLRFGQLGITRPGADYLDALERLSGQSFGANWPAWIEWYGGTEIEPPPGFTTWKGNALGRIDSRFAEFLQDEHPTTIRPEEIQWGGVVVDGIPALDQPRMLAASQADYLGAEEPVFGIALNGEARAYPLRIIDWHEMANDTIGGIPVSLAYCTLCGSAIAYDGRASDGMTYDFGSSGFLFRSNKLMYDRQTRTLWNQLTGEPVMGPLVGQDVTLDLLPVVLTTWGEWQRQHPETQVLDINTGHSRVYELGYAYGDYFASEGTMFPVWQRSDLLADKDQVYALRIDGEPVAYPLTTLASERVINDTIGETGVVLIAPNEIVDVAGQSRRTGAEVSYSAGSEVRAYAREAHEFSASEESDQVVDEAGRIWQVTEEALVGPEGELAPRIAGHLAYWFGWYAFFPQTEVYGIDQISQ